MENVALRELKHRLWSIFLCGAFLPNLVAAQESAPVTIDASPTATELFRRANEQAQSNPAESARLVQEAMDRFGNKLVPWAGEVDRYRSAMADGEDFLLNHPAVLERWLREQSPIAERQFAEGASLEVTRVRMLTPTGLTAAMQLAQDAMDMGRPNDAVIWLTRALRHPNLDEAQRARLQNLVNTLRPQRPLATPWPVQTSPTQPPATTWQPLWSQALPSSWLNRRLTDMDPALATRTKEQFAEDGSSLVSQSRFAKDTILVGDGAYVQSLDRFSGSLIWRTLVGSATDKAAGPICDLTVAQPIGNLVVTLPGNALAEQRSAPSRVVALDMASGHRAWEVRLDQFDRPEFEDLFPHGDPLAVGDLIVVQARKSNSRLESAAWLLGLDRATGDIRWAISLGAAGGIRLAASRPLSSLAVVGEDVIAATSLGVVARIDAATGDVRWLRRWPAPIREPRLSTPAWQLPSPVADERLIAWLAPDAETLIGFDPVNGTTLWTQPVGVSTVNGATRTLLLDSNHLYAIGDDVVALDRSDPHHVVWRLSEKLPSPMSPLRGAAAIGTLQDGSSALVVPLADRVMVIDPRSGEPIGACEMVGGGNVDLHMGNLVVVGGQSIALAMPGVDGEKLLRDRLAQNPADPRRGLALVELGRAWKRGALILDGAAATHKALQRLTTSDADAVREEVVLKLLDKEVLALVPATEAAAMIALAHSIAQSPQQRALVLLRRGAWLAAAGKTDDAVNEWIQLCLDPSLRHAMIPIDLHRSVCAGILATESLSTSATSRGLSMLLQRLVAATDADAIMETVRSAMDLCKSLSDREQVLAAVQSISHARNDPHVLQTVRSLTEIPPPVPFPKIGPIQAEPIRFAARLVEEGDDAKRERPTNAMLLATAAKLSLYRGSNLHTSWSVAFNDRNPVVASWNPAVVIWSAEGGTDGSVTSLDPETGRTLFRVDRASELFEHIGDDQAMAHDAVDRRAQRDLECFRAGEHLLLVRGDGDVVALKLRGDGKPLWKLSHALAGVEIADASALGLALVGPTGESLDGSNHITIVRSDDGSAWLHGEWPESLGRPMWIKLLPQGLMACGDGGVARLDLAPGLPPLWIQLDRRVRASELQLVSDAWIVLSDRAPDQFYALSLRTGELRGEFLDVPDSFSLGPVAQVLQVHGTVIANRLGRVSMHDAQGNLLGVDAMSSPHRFDAIVAVDGGVIVADSGEREFNGGVVHPRSLQLRTLDVEQGLRSVQPPVAIDNPAGRITALIALDGWVVFGDEDHTIAVPAPPFSPLQNPR